MRQTSERLNDFRGGQIRSLRAAPFVSSPAPIRIAERSGRRGVNSPSQPLEQGSNLALGILLTGSVSVKRPRLVVGAGPAIIIGRCGIAKPAVKASGLASKRLVSSLTRPSEVNTATVHTHFPHHRTNPCGLGGIAGNGRSSPKWPFGRAPNLFVNPHIGEKHEMV